tara:strand:- start:2314 stop:2619 length:306 start_codon:yes stop_codon:yes gene_type:complete
MLVRIYKKHEINRGGSHDDGSAWRSTHDELEIVRIPDGEGITQTTIDEMIRELEDSIVEEMANQDYNYSCHINLIFEGYFVSNIDDRDILYEALLQKEVAD